MPEPVKRTRSYDSSRRLRQAAVTRREILEAARRLFERRGYASTTMAAIAEEAGVSLKTVYVAFSTKSGVLRALWNLLLRGDEDDTPVPERDWYRGVLAEADPRRQLLETARNSRVVKERVGGIFEVIHAAAPTDGDIAALWERIQTEFRAVLREIVASIEAKGALAPALDVERATDLLWTLSHPSVWQLLVRERGWTPDAYEAWCAELTCAELLAPAKRRR
jgi:AcrR family transcriptional regulator